MTDLNVFIFLYVVVAFLIVYIQEQRLNLVDVLTSVKDAKAREKLKKVRVQISRDIYMSVVWPVLPLRAFYNVIKQKIKENST